MKKKIKTVLDENKIIALWNTGYISGEDIAKILDLSESFVDDVIESYDERGFEE